MRELLELLQEAGHADFRDARGPMGFSQRQAAGKFSRDEADAFIDQLREAHEERSDGDDGAPAAPDAPAPRAAAPRRAAPRHAAPTPSSAPRTAAEQTLRKFPSELLAAELQRRGWVVLEP